MESSSSEERPQEGATVATALDGLYRTKLGVDQCKQPGDMITIDYYGGAHAIQPTGPRVGSVLKADENGNLEYRRLNASSLSLNKPDTSEGAERLLKCVAKTFEEEGPALAEQARGEAGQVRYNVQDALSALQVSKFGFVPGDIVPGDMVRSLDDNTANDIHIPGTGRVMRVPGDMVRSLDDNTANDIHIPGTGRVMRVCPDVPVTRALTGETVTETLPDWGMVATTEVGTTDPDKNVQDELDALKASKFPILSEPVTNSGELYLTTGSGTNEVTPLLSGPPGTVLTWGSTLPAWSKQQAASVSVTSPNYNNTQEYIDGLEANKVDWPGHGPGTSTGGILLVSTGPHADAAELKPGTTGQVLKVSSTGDALEWADPGKTSFNHELNTDSEVEFGVVVRLAENTVEGFDCALIGALNDAQDITLTSGPGVGDVKPGNIVLQPGYYSTTKMGNMICQQQSFAMLYSCDDSVRDDNIADLQVGTIMFSTTTGKLSVYTALGWGTVAATSA